MNVLPIDVIARSERFEAAALGRELRPWEWTFIHAVDGRTQLRDVAERCGLELGLAAEIVSEQTEAGILRVVTMTLDDYRRWSGRESEAESEAGRAEPPAPGRALHDELLAGLLSESTVAAEPVTEPQTVAVEAAVPAPAEPLASEPFVPETLASDLFAHDLFTPEPLVGQPVAAEQPAPISFALDSLAPDPLAPDPFAPDPFAHDPFAHDPFALDAGAPEPLGVADSGSAAKGVAFSFDEFDGFDQPDPAPHAQAPAAPEGITLSFEPGDRVADVPPPFSAGGGVSLSFEPDSSPLDAAGFTATGEVVPVVPVVPAYLPPAAPMPPAAGPAEGHAEPPDSGAPINLAFSPDGFPILTPAVSSQPPHAAPSAPAGAAAGYPPPAPAPETPATGLLPEARSASAPVEDHSDIVGSLIARVLSIRIK